MRNVFSNNTSYDHPKLAKLNLINIHENSSNNVDLGLDSKDNFLYATDSRESSAERANDDSTAQTHDRDHDVQVTFKNEHVSFIKKKRK